MRATVITLLAIAIGLFVYNPVAFANHGGSTAAPWHSDVMTINQTGSLGTNGTRFVPAWVKTDCDTVPINGRAISISDPNATGCHGFAEEVTNAWLEGGYWDPRGGTEFIPPSGDHHRAGWRAMMQAHFSAGAWLAGFAPISTTFPFYPNTGTAGPGETPIGTYELCGDQDGAGPGNSNDVNGSGPIDTDAHGFDGPTDGSDVTPAEELAQPGLTAAVVACRARARTAGALLLEFVDHHGEPMTPGRFPRYIPHERQAWVSTIVTKYTASPLNNIDTDGDQVSDATGARISQVFRSQHNFVTDRVVTWFSMSDESAVGCTGTGWCQWLWDPTTGTLLKLENADPNAPVSGGGPAPGTFTAPTAADMITAGATTVDSINVIDDYNDVTVNKPLNTIEKAPSEIYQVIGQWVELGGFTGASNGNPAGDTQAFWQEFWALSGPNFQSEEGANPYSWMLCGLTTLSPANEDCRGSNGSAIDAPLKAPSIHAVMAITGFGLDVVNRYGGDLRPDNSADQGCVQGDEAVGVCDDTSCAIPGSACDMGLNTAIVQCVVNGDTDSNPLTSDCLSAEGSTNGYGNDANETLYYREAVENRQRGFIRENRAFAFSFINGAGVNNGFAGSGLSTTLRQAVAQNVDENGFMMSCLNCEPRPEHQVQNHGLPNYSFNWTLTGGIDFVEHSAILTDSNGDGLGDTGFIP
jgi:hypothetical protein